MTDRTFVDTNVLVYSKDTSHPEKHARAVDLMESLWTSRCGRISVQVLNELANVARRKMGLAWTEVQALTETLRALLNVVPLDADMHAHGLRLCERNGFSVYDGMIVAAALSAGCDTLWSEDMHAGLKVEGRLTIRNPFVI